MGTARRRAPLVGLRGRQTRHDRHWTGRPFSYLRAAWLAARTSRMGGVLLSVRGTGSERGRLGWLGYASASPAEQSAPLAAFLT